MKAQTGLVFLRLQIEIDHQQGYPFARSHGAFFLKKI